MDIGRRFVSSKAPVPLAQLLQALKTKFHQSSVNAELTLPLDIGSKNSIYALVAADSSKQGWRLKSSQSYAYAKQLLRFYKYGISLVWRNNREARQLRKNKYKMTGHLDSHGKDVAIAIPSLADLTKYMAQHLYMSAIENANYNEATTGDVVKTNKQVSTVDDKLFRLTRAEYQLLKRTPLDFVKIPSFAILVALFMETTPILCYMFPEITPLTCVLPSILPRIWRTKNIEKLQAIAKSIDNEADYAMKTAYNLPVADVRALADLLRLKTKYIPTPLFPEFVLRSRLQKYYNYLLVDNYYLSGRNGDGNIWNLNNQELVMACLERNLVADPTELVRVQSLGTLEERTLALEDLRKRLERFILDFERSNVGYLTVACWKQYLKCI